MYFGGNITNQLKRGGVTVDNDIVLKAITDVVQGKPTQLTDSEKLAVLNQLRAALQAKQREEAEEAKAKGDAYLAQFAKSPGVVTLTNGLEYKVIKDGTGPMPKDTDSVVMGYKGTLIDGTEFDQNDSFKTPVKGRTIQGWQKILPLMKEGSEWQVAIPANLGYGPRGMPPKIPGNSVLIFDMELKSITAGGPMLPPMTQGAAKPTASTSSTPVVSGEIIKVPSADELKKGAKIEVIKDGQTNAAQ
jgi:FKBP-type peptidyl-prolyl cis-trans isomerase